jgi:hypothetical protein
MSIIRRYKDFNINEELFGLTKLEKIDRRMKNIQDSLDKYLPVWIRKKAINVPNKADLDNFWNDAKSDDYASGDILGGSSGVGIGPEKNLIYRKSSGIKTKGPGLEGVNEGFDDQLDEFGIRTDRPLDVDRLSDDEDFDRPIRSDRPLIDDELDSGMDDDYLDDDMTRDGLIEILLSSTDFDKSDLDSMSDDELGDLWDKMKMEDWLNEIDQEEERNEY